MTADDAAITRLDTTGVLLAGGKARRMNGQDKGLLVAAGKPLAEHTLLRLRPQVTAVLVNANRHAEQYAAWGDVVADLHKDFCGPLAGIYAGMRAAKTPWILSVPCDSPFFPRCLAARLMQVARANNARIAIARANKRAQPVFMLAQTALADSLADFLDGGGRKIDLWYAQHSHGYADFADDDSFANINTPEELAAADVRLRDVESTDSV